MKPQYLSLGTSLAGLVPVACALMAQVAVAGTLIAVPPFPGSTSTSITGINDHNVIVGTYQAGDYHGFVGTLDGAYTTFDAPNGSTLTGRIDNHGYIYISFQPVRLRNAVG